MATHDGICRAHRACAALATALLASPGCTRIPRHQPPTAGEARGGGPVMTGTSRGIYLGMIAAADRAEVELGLLAASRAASPQVRRYAQQTLEYHLRSTAQWENLAAQVGLLPMQGPVSERLERDATQLRTALSPLQGRDFDSGYIAAQIEQHQRTLRLIDDEILPNVTDAPARTALLEARAAAAEHLRTAETIQGQIETH